LNRATDHRSWTLVGAAILLAVLAVAVAGALATGDGDPGRRRAVGFAAGVDGLAFECRGEAGFSESPISSIHRGTR